MKLNDLKVGEEATILMVEAKDNIKKRLLDIGLVKGSKVKAILISPGKEMVAYYIKGAVIAIRRDDTENILVKVI